MQVLNVLILIAMIGVAGFLLVGVLGMVRGGEFNRKYGNLLMRGRILSAVALVILFAIGYFVRRGGS